ncbi:hypothetical protein [Mesorhizobium sp.]|uniref:hypothetical protein n=1 Tax=Mesorhizobium sp. TaxID=1871066 RepID=UPI0025CE88A2|nr:hypothetical protein [Mesorhizobium sp.]
MNGTASLKEGTRDRIEKAVAALMHRPSSFARSLPGRAPRRPKNLDHLPRLLVAGRVSVDFLCRVDVLPHRDDRITASHIDKALGGPAANLAVAAAGIGAPYALDVELATAVGQDPESDWALGALSKLCPRLADPQHAQQPPLPGDRDHRAQWEPDDHQRTVRAWRGRPDSQSGYPARATSGLPSYRRLPLRDDDRVHRSLSSGGLEGAPSNSRPPPSSWSTITRQATPHPHEPI